MLKEIKKAKKTPLIAGVFFVLLAIFSVSLLFFSNSNPHGFANQEQFLVAKEFYTTSCASCHGLKGEGLKTGLLAAPSLNGSGHAWHHTDQQVAKWIREGIGDMPAVAPEWSDETIKDLHSYIKLWWSEEQRNW